MDVLVILIFFIACLVLTNVHLKDKAPISNVIDYGHKAFANPFLTNRQFIIEIVSVLFYIYAAVRLDRDDIKNILIQYMILFIIRAGSISMTVLPKSNPTCKVGKGLFNNLCNDMVFSGHTTSLLLILLTLYDKKEISLGWGIFLLLGYGYLIVASRMHYSVDVYLASIITFLFHYYYKDYILNTNKSSLTCLDDH